MTTIGGSIFGALSLPFPAYGQTSPRGVPAVRPDQLQTAEPPRSAATVPVAARSPTASIRPFTLTRVQVAGSTLPDEDLAAAYQPYIGRLIDNAALSSMTQALAAIYAKSDIALYTVLVPQQSFAGGELRLMVVEGFVSRIEIRGKLRKSRLGLLQAYLRRLETERPLRTSALQRVISFIYDLPGVTATPTFNQGGAQGAVTLVVEVKENPVQVAVGINDRGTALLGRTQVQADMLFNGIFAGADQLRTTIVLPTHTSRFQYYAGTYGAPLDSDGTSFTTNLSYLRTRPAAIPLKGKATSFGLQLSRALVRRFDRSWHVTAGVDGIDTHNALLGFTLSNDRVRALRLGSSYIIASKRNQLSLSVTASLGLDVLGARVVAGQSKQRFRKVNGRVNDSLLVGRNFVFRLNAFGQAAGDDLPSSEQIALGGDEFGRAYESALIAGDTGYAGSAELAWVLPKSIPTVLSGSELYLYADQGRVWYRGRFGLDGASSHLASVGGGVRVHVAAKTVFQIEGVRGLTNPVFYEDREKVRVLFSVKSLL